MTLTLHTPVRVGNQAWRVGFDSTLAGPYRLYIDGVLIETTLARQVIIPVTPQHAPVIEILDDPDQLPTVIYPPYVRIHWNKVPSAQSYRIEQYNDDTTQWDPLKTRPDAGLPYMSYQTGALDDESTDNTNSGVHQFRVIAIGAEGNESTAATLTVLMVRNPDPPVVAMSYDNATQKVTIA